MGYVSRGQDHLEQQDLNALGLKPNRARIVQLCLGMIWPVLFVVVFEYSVSLLVHNPYRINPAFHWKDLRSSTYYLIRSVAYEDLIFRGALLYILIQKIGSQKALLVSSAAFGIYHWYSYQAFGNPSQMLLIFLTTGAAGYVFALAFERTGSIYLPFGLHFGIDFAMTVLFPQQKNIGTQLLFKSFPKDPVSPAAWISILVILVYFLGFPTFTFLGVRRMRQ